MSARYGAASASATTAAKRGAPATGAGTAATNGSDSDSASSSDSMPPLLPADEEEEDDEAASVRVPLMSAMDADPAATPASSTGSSSPSAASPPPPPVPSSWWSFGPDRVRCTSDYGCCLRYSLHLAPCCMPPARDYPHLPSYRWLQARFYPLHADAPTLAFLRECDKNYFARGWLSWWGLRVGFLKPLLRRCMAHTDVNGFLRCGLMFLTSREQIQTVLQQSIPDCLRGQPGVEWPWSTPSSSASSSASSSPSGPRLLDIGAGDGHITSQFSSLFSEVVATEVSAQMVARLKARGFTTIHAADLDQGMPLGGEVAGPGFDCVTLFNVLDRCARPRTLLRQIRDRMRKPTVVSVGGGHSTVVNSSRLVLSVPLPLDPSVETGTRWVDPEERILNLSARSRNPRDFETAACALADMLLEVGFNIESLSRIPYLSQGDTVRPFYVLDCSLWVLSVRAPGEPVPRREEVASAAAAAGGAHQHGGVLANNKGASVSAALPKSILNLAAEVD